MGRFEKNYNIKCARVLKSFFTDTLGHLSVLLYVYIVDCNNNIHEEFYAKFDNILD